MTSQFSKFAPGQMMLSITTAKGVFIKPDFAMKKIYSTHTRLQAIVSRG
jgi:hypothetical protein